MSIVASALSFRFPRPTLTAVIRSLLGLVFVLFGLNGFFHFVPLPPPPPGPAAELFEGLFATGYFVPLQKGIEVTGGLLLLGGLCVPFALTLLAPVAVNVLAFHLFLVPQGLPVAVFLVAAEVYLALHHRQAFAPLFATRHQPRAVALHQQRPAEAPAGVR